MKKLLPFITPLLLAAAGRSWAAFVPVIPENLPFIEKLSEGSVPLGLELEPANATKHKPAPAPAPKPSKPKEIREIGKKEFDAEVRTSSTPVMVYFFATWCKACQTVSPIIDYLAEQNPSVKFVKVDIDKEPGLAKEFKVASVPLFMGAKGGKYGLFVLELEVDDKGNVVGARLVPKP